SRRKARYCRQHPKNVPAIRRVVHPYRWEKSSRSTPGVDVTVNRFPVLQPSILATKERPHAVPIGLEREAKAGEQPDERRDDHAARAGVEVGPRRRRHDQQPNQDGTRDHRSASRHAPDPLLTSSLRRRVPSPTADGMRASMPLPSLLALPSFVSAALAGAAGPPSPPSRRGPQ